MAEVRRKRSGSRKITVALPPFLFEQFCGRGGKFSRRAAGESFVPFSPGHFPLYGFQYNFTQGAFLLTSVTPQPIVQLFGNVFNLDIGHASKIAVHSCAGNVLEGNFAGPRSVEHQSELIQPALEIADLTILETTKSDARLY